MPKQRKRKPRPSNGRKKGGAQPGAGRPASEAKKAMIAASREAAAVGMSPLEYMLNIMRDPEATISRRDGMAIAAAGYVHPRLNAVKHSGDVTVTHEQAVMDMEAAANAVIIHEAELDELNGYPG